MDNTGDFMNEKEKMTKKMKLVSMNEVDITTDDKYIIGTDALATCVGVLLYCESKKRAIVGHFSVDGLYLATPMLELIFDNGLNDDDFSRIKYKIIPGYEEEHYDLKNDLEKLCQSLHPLFIPFSDEEIPSNAIEKDGDLSAVRFAFDASSGKFVTDKVLYGVDYFSLQNEEKENKIK